MAKRKRKKKSKEDISTENEFLKMKMMAEFGGDFTGNEGLPPEVENQFLKQIISFQRQHHNQKTTTVYKFIKEPEYNHADDLSDRQIKTALRKLLAYMKRKRVVLEVLAPTPDRDIYRFITEELFKHEIDDIRIKGWVSHFVYEEFHPNAEYDVKNSLHYVLLYLFDKNTPFFPENFSEEMKDHLGLSTDADEINQRVENFKSGFHNTRLVNYDITELKIDAKNGTAFAQCTVTYSTQGMPKKRFKREVANVEIHLTTLPETRGWWTVSRINW